MRIFLDDIRNPPDYTYIVCRSYTHAVQLLLTECVEYISFDHDLGGEKTGYDLACLIEERAMDGRKPPDWSVHSANPVGRDNINRAMQKAHELYKPRKWERRFLSLAREISLWSKDPSTKCGAVIARGHFIVSLGYNGFPARTLDSPELYADRERKLARVVHAELNAILSARGSVEGCTLYVYPMPPCSHCASAIIQAGIRRVWSVEPTREQLDRWGTSFVETTQMFAEAGVWYDELKFV